MRLLCAEAVRQTEACCLMVACALPHSYQCGVYPGNYSRFTSDWTQVYQTAYMPTIAPLPWFSVFGAHTLPERRCGRIWYDACETRMSVHAMHCSTPLLARPRLHGLVAALTAPPCGAQGTTTSSSMVRIALARPPPRCLWSLLHCMPCAHRPVLA